MALCQSVLEFAWSVAESQRGAGLRSVVVGTEYALGLLRTLAGKVDFFIIVAASVALDCHTDGEDVQRF
jgi:hypothetical protein